MTVSILSFFSGVVYSCMVPVVFCANGLSASISGTRRGQAESEKHVDAAPREARTSPSQRVRATGRCVVSSPICLLCPAWTAAWALGAITPTTGTRNSVWSSGRAAAVAELQATTTSFTPCASRNRPISRAKRRSSGERPRPVRKPRTVAEIDEVLVRKRDEAFVQHRQATDAGVEHTDGPLVHCAGL